MSRVTSDSFHKAEDVYWNKSTKTLISPLGRPVKRVKDKGTYGIFSYRPISMDGQMNDPIYYIVFYALEEVRVVAENYRSGLYTEIIQFLESEKRG